MHSRCGLSLIEKVTRVPQVQKQIENSLETTITNYCSNKNNYNSRLIL